VGDVAHEPSSSSMSETVRASSGGPAVAVGAEGIGAEVTLGVAAVEGTGVAATISGARDEAVADAVGAGALHATPTRMSATKRRTAYSLRAFDHPRVRLVRLAYELLP